MKYGTAIYLSAALGSMVLGGAAAAQDEAAVREAAKRDMEANMAALAAEADNQADDDESETVQALAEIEAEDAIYADEEDDLGQDGAYSDFGAVYTTGITAADYPAKAWRDGVEGTVGFELDYDVTGQITGCRITEGSGSAMLDAATCPIILERAKAELWEDDPAPGTMQGSYRWQRSEPEFGDFTFRMAYTLGADGISRDCEILTATGDLPEDFAKMPVEQECAVSRRGVPYRNESGEPVAKRMVITFTAEEIPFEPE